MLSRDVYQNISCIIHLDLSFDYCRGATVSA
jgi:hypothetical protein